MNPLVERSDPAGSLALDLKYALRPGLTLTATANPDFGQVEADPAVVNLDAFETFFQERRPFFLERSGTFQFNVDCNDGACTGLFYSHRIGRAPQGSPPLDDDEYSATPTAATIIGAAKVTGRVGKFSGGGPERGDGRRGRDDCQRALAPTRSDRADVGLERRPRPWRVRQSVQHRIHGRAVRGLSRGEA